MTTKPYLVRPGVETVDGRPVPEDRIVHLSDEAARFDLDAGKIVPAGATGGERRKKQAAPEPDHGGD